MASITFSQSYGLGLNLFSGVHLDRIDSDGVPYIEVDNFWAGRLFWTGDFVWDGRDITGTIWTIDMPAVGVTITELNVDYDKLHAATNNANPQDWEIGKLLFGRRDTFRGSDGNDAIDTWQGNDVLRGFGGDDSLYAGLGEDVLYGGKGNDLLVAGYRSGIKDGNNKLYGGAGDDGLFGGTGDDEIFGGNGNDYLNGDNENHDGGNDLLVGGKGADMIDGSVGNDIMRGGGGADTFDFEWRDKGVTHIRDFKDDVDTLSLSQNLWGKGLNVQWALDRAQVEKGHVVFRFDNGVVVHIDNVSDKSILEDDILITL